MRTFQLGDTSAAAATPAAAAAPTGHDEDGKYVFQYALQNGDNFNDLKINIDVDSDFELTHLYGIWDQEFTFNLYTPGGRLIASSNVKAEDFLGTAQFPVPMLAPQIYPRGSQLRLSIANSYAGVNNVEIVFAGLKHYDT
jgi:hypothetical protein